LNYLRLDITLTGATPPISDIVNALSYDMKLVDGSKSRISKRPNAKISRTFIKREFKMKTSNVVFVDVAEVRCNHTSMYFHGPSGSS
jgi:hypothetical protein